ncbi:uncharacterized protein LOC126903652 [Daktulosphaira vitifoliae]|uniref:uncharacterized protein LOC126903652 n=1 Tax=Daktulosphaira vitifoliae TaxID=58002 RepID=UPI0021AA4662|nr:uncharacterized protein LOC126903652 [Daktulosphaira vitifoliae]
MDKETVNVISRLKIFKTEALLGGWVTTLKEQLEIHSENEVLLKGEVLTRNRKHRLKEHHKFVSQNRDYSAICNEIVDFLVNFLQERFDIDADTVKILKPFTELEPSVDMKAVHKLIGNDLDLAELSMEYSELLTHKNIEQLKKISLKETLQALVMTNFFPNVSVIMARIVAVKPHSADVERVISVNNLLKTSNRSSLSIESENEYLYIYFNLPPLAEWNPRPAINEWFKKKRRVRETVTA